MSTTPLIIFGPTGHVGSAVTRSIHDYGAKTVYLGMRTTDKPIPGLSSEKELGFHRIEADLSKPETVRAAVEKSGANRAFMYIIRGSPDHMRSSIEALKSGGIEFVVFLSSGGIRSDLRAIQPSDIIPWMHAQVEINLEEVFGKHSFVAVRPTYFASNSFFFKSMVIEGDVKLPYPEVKFDWISPGDIGRVCAAILAAGLKPGERENVVRLCGSRIMSQKDAIGVIGTVLGKDIRIKAMTEDEALEIYQKMIGIPPPMAKYFVNMLKERNEDTDGYFKGPSYEEAVANIQKYTGKQPTRFEEWVKENKQEFIG